MGLSDDLRQLADQVRKRQPHVKGEEATKQALIIPFLQVLGFDVYDPQEVGPEYTADFAKKKANGRMEKVDYVIRINKEPAMLIECKPLGAAPEDHDGQLARYFNATPTVHVGVVTNGTRYRFFTDLRAPNMMDDKPFFEFDILSLTERDTENLRAFTKDGFNPAVIQSAAEDIIYTDRLTRLVNEVLRNPSETFVRFLLAEIDLVPGRVTGKVIDRFTPIVKRAVQTTLLEMLTRSIQQEITNPQVAPTEAAAVETVQAVPPTEPPAEVRRGSVITTTEELELFGIVGRICAESASKQAISYKDTTAYFGINLGKVTQWFIRAWCGTPRKALVTRVPVEQVRLLAHGFEVETAPECLGTSRVYFTVVRDVEKLRPLILMAYEEQIRRMNSGADDDPAPLPR
jgi:hypothetical protein